MAVSHEQHGGVDEETGQVQDSWNTHFVQIYYDSMEFIESLIDENPMAARVLLVLIRLMKSGSNIAEITQKGLATHFRCTERHVQMAIKLLIERKALRVIKAGKNNSYQINVKVAWTTNANAKKNKTLFSEPMEFSDEHLSRPKIKSRSVKKAYVD